MPSSVFSESMWATLSWCINSGKWREGRTHKNILAVAVVKSEMNLVKWPEFHVHWVLCLCQVTCS